MASNITQFYRQYWKKSLALLKGYWMHYYCKIGENETSYRNICQIYGIASPFINTIWSSNMYFYRYSNIIIVIFPYYLSFYAARHNIDFTYIQFGNYLQLMVSSKMVVAKTLNLLLLLYLRFFLVMNIWQCWLVL